MIEPATTMIFQAHGVSFDRNPALSLQVHVVQNLFSHLALGKRSRQFEQAVRQGGFAMVDMGNDGKVSDACSVHALIRSDCRGNPVVPGVMSVGSQVWQ